MNYNKSNKFLILGLARREKDQQPATTNFE